MCFRLKTFLFCVSLRNAGFSIVCFNFVLFGVVIYNYVLLPLLKIIDGAALILLAVFIVCAALVMMFYTLEFLDGMAEQNVEQMRVYNLLCIIKLATVVMGTAIFVNARSKSSNDEKSIYNPSFDEISSEGRFYRIYANQSQENPTNEVLDSTSSTFELVFRILYAALEIYVFACINSLFSEIAEETNPKGSQISINQQQPLTSAYGHQLHYTATPHLVQPGPSYAPGCSNVTVIPLHASNR